MDEIAKLIRKLDMTHPKELERLKRYFIDEYLLKTRSQQSKERREQLYKELMA